MKNLLDIEWNEIVRTAPMKGRGHYGEKFLRLIGDAVATGGNRYIGFGNILAIFEGRPGMSYQGQNIDYYTVVDDNGIVPRRVSIEGLSHNPVSDVLIIGYAHFMERYYKSSFRSICYYYKDSAAGFSGAWDDLRSMVAMDGDDD